MTKPETKRLDYLDCAHGLMILHMMFYHLCDYTIMDSGLHDIILQPLSFFMAWFFYKSGMFYKDRNFNEVFRYGIKRLIVPAIVFSLIGFILYLVIEHPKTTLFEEFEFFYLYGSFHGNTPIWFLFALFSVQILFYFMRKINLNLVFIAILSIGLFFLNKQIGFRPYWTLYIPIGLLFFTLGNIFKDIQYNKTVTIICIVVFFAYLFYSNNLIIFILGRFSPFVVTISFSLAGCILTNNLFKSFPQFCIKPLRFFCHHAMEFLCTHLIVLDAIKSFMRKTSMSENIVFECTAFIIYIIILSTLIHFFKIGRLKWIFGK